jgi:hypothetical protein
MRNFGKIWLLVAVMGLFAACLLMDVRKPATVSLLPGTPGYEVKLLLTAIGDKNWQDACTHLSAGFLAGHQQDVVAGTYFAQTRKQDRTCFYTSEAQIESARTPGAGGAGATVRLRLGKPDTLWDQLLRRPPHKMGWCDVQLVKENGQWKVDDF